MALPATAGAKFIGDRITVQHDLRDFLPVRALGLRIQQTQIGDVMPFVIDGYGVASRRFIVHIGIEFDGNPGS